MATEEYDAKIKDRGKVPFEELPKELQELLSPPEPSKDGKRERSKKPGLKEGKVKAVGHILSILSPFTTPQQRTILKFTMETLETANKRWSNDTVREQKNGAKGGADSN